MTWIILITILALIAIGIIVRTRVVYRGYPLVLCINFAIFTAPVWMLYLLIENRFKDTLSWQELKPWFPWVLLLLSIFVYWIASTSVDKKKEGTFWKGVFATAEPNQAVVLSDTLLRFFAPEDNRQNFSLRVVLAGKTIPKYLWETAFKTIDLKREFRSLAEATEFNLGSGTGITVSYLIKSQVRRTEEACLCFIRNEEDSITRFLKTVAEAFLNTMINNYWIFKDAVDASGRWRLDDWLKNDAEGREYKRQLEVLGITTPILLVGDMDQAYAVQTLKDVKATIEEVTGTPIVSGGAGMAEIELVRKLAETAVFLNKQSRAIVTSGGGGSSVIVNP